MVMLVKLQIKSTILLFFKKSLYCFNSEELAYASGRFDHAQEVSQSCGCNRLLDYTESEEGVLPTYRAVKCVSSMALIYVIKQLSSEDVFIATQTKS